LTYCVGMQWKHTGLYKQRIWNVAIGDQG